MDGSSWGAWTVRRKGRRRCCQPVPLNDGIRSLTERRFTACWVSEVCSQPYAAEGKLRHMCVQVPTDTGMRGRRFTGCCQCSIFFSSDKTNHAFFHCMSFNRWNESTLQLPFPFQLICAGWKSSWACSRLLESALIACQVQRLHVFLSRRTGLHFVWMSGIPTPNHQLAMDSKKRSNLKQYFNLHGIKCTAMRSLCHVLSILKPLSEHQQQTAAASENTVQKLCLWINCPVKYMSKNNLCVFLYENPTSQPFRLIKPHLTPRSCIMGGKCVCLQTCGGFGLIYEFLRVLISHCRWMRRWTDCFSPPQLHLTLHLPRLPLVEPRLIFAQISEWVDQISFIFTVNPTCSTWKYIYKKCIKSFVAAEGAVQSLINYLKCP